MPFRSPSPFTLIFVLLLFSGCSTPESQERLDTVLCWLRPSCLPSHPSHSQSPAAPPVSKITPNSPKPNPPHNIPQSSATPTVAKVAPSPPQSKRTQNLPPQIRPSTKCLTSAQLTVQASKPYVTVSYVEPTTKANGQKLTNLAKTTIYHDLGEGLVKYQDIPATNPQGGGIIQEKIHLTISTGTSIQTTICVTATDTNGREG